MTIFDGLRDADDPGLPRSPTIRARELSAAEVDAMLAELEAARAALRRRCRRRQAIGDALGALAIVLAGLCLWLVTS